MVTDYKSIREGNIKKYGTDTWYEDLLSNMYSDKTHFIYELIQNAEDADATKITFDIFNDRIEIIHNGKRLFDIEDVEGICGLAKGTKKEDLTKIGKFGLGFKSVYAYTDTPLVYSGEEHFKIEKFVRPYHVEPLHNLDPGLTKFILPFKKDLDHKKAFDEITTKMTAIDLKEILFLRNIKSISWSIDANTTGEYEKISCEEKPFTIKKLVNNQSKETEYWLLMSKPMRKTGDKELCVEIAFKLDYKGINKYFIIPSEKTELVVFFPTTKETHLHFLVQGPYRTTHNRENIPPEDWNQELVKKTAELITEALSGFKDAKLLDVNTLQLFPIDKSNFDENSMFYPFYKAVKEKIMSNEDILPTFDGDYISSKNGLIARTRELRELLDSKQISVLFKKVNAKWLDDSITIDKTPALRTYLIEEIKMEEITPEKFANIFSEDFIKAQNDAWVIRFYNFLTNQEALLRQGSIYTKVGILRAKPFIRLKGDKHIVPFDGNGKPLVFLPSGNIYDTNFKIVKESIVKDHGAKEFLKSIGLKEPNKVAGIREHIIPKYLKSELMEEGEEDISNGCDFDVNLKKIENLKDVDYIKKTIQGDNSQEVNELINELKDVEFLIAKNPTNNKVVFAAPKTIYLSKVYTKSEELDIYFETNLDVLFLDECYLNILTLEDLKRLGCNCQVKIKYKKAGWDDHVNLANYFAWHKRGLNGFDPDSTMDGLGFALNNITIDKAKVIWWYMKRHFKLIKGIVESSRRQDFAYSDKEEKISEMGKQIIDNSWLPDRQGDFHTPEVLLLSEIYDTFDKESTEAKILSDKIMKKPIEEEIIKSLPEDEREKFELALSLAKKFSKEEICKILDEKSKDETICEPDKGEPKIEHEPYSNTLKGSVSPHDIDLEESTTYPNISEENLSEEERKLQNQQDIEDAKDNLEKMKEKEINRKIRESTHIDSGMKSKLIQDYDGRCQICFEKILDNNNMPHMKIKRLVTPHQSNLGISDESNLLALCPNCWTKISPNFPWCFIKEGKASIEPDFENIEGIDKYDLDYQSIKIRIRGKDNHIHYKKAHLNKFKQLYKDY